MDNTSGENPHLHELRECVKRAFSNESRLEALKFQPSQSDVFITTGPKSGTTWLQQICHGLRSRGSMDFDEISSVVPFLERAHDYGYEDLQAPQPYSPRMYKTHLWYPSCPKGAGKYIVVARRPADVAVSYFHFYENWMFSAGSISLVEFVEQYFLKLGAPKSDLEISSQIHHIWSWYPHRHDQNVLWLHYEDLKQNLRECVRLIADFLEIGSGDEELQELATYQATFEFMKQNIDKFNDSLIRQSICEARGLPTDAGVTSLAGKIRQGMTNASKSILPQDTLEKVYQRWKAVMLADTGYESYEDMRTGINKELGRMFT